MTIQYTLNRNYPKPDFDTRTWHQQMWQSLDMIDADITAELQGVSGFVVEAWDNNRGYLINAKVMDVDRLQLYVCNVNHTSAASGSMTADRTAHPTYWTSFGVPLVPRGVWAQNTAYNVMDHVYDTVQGVSAICALAHTSTASGNIRTDASKWLFIVDLQLILSNNVITSPTTGILLTLRSTDPGASPAPDLVLDRASASPAVNDVLGRIIFNGNNSALIDVQYAHMRATVVDPTAGAHTGFLGFVTTVAGAFAERLRLGSGLYSVGAVGGDKGNDTINATALYEGGVALTAKYGQLSANNNWTGTQTISSSGVSPLLTLTSTDAGAGAAPLLDLTRDSASPAVGDILSNIRFFGRSSTNVFRGYGSIYTIINDPTNGAEYSTVTISNMLNGAANGMLFGQGFYLTGAAGFDKGQGTGNFSALYENGNPISARYAAGAGAGNILRRNGGMELWQRGAGGAASFAVAASAGNPYTADGWYLNNGANQACTISQQAGLTNGSQWSAKLQRNNGQTGVGQLAFGYPLDTDEIYPLLGQFICVSYTAKAGANFSASGGTLFVSISVGTGSPVKLFTGYTGGANVLNTPGVLTTTAVRFQTFSPAIIPINTRQMEVTFQWTPVGTAGADDSFYIDDVQLEIVPAASGYVASAFQRLNFEEQLLLCLRHFNKTFDYATAPATAVGVGTGEWTQGTFVAGASAKSNVGEFRYPVPMRVAPSIIKYNPGAANAEIRNLQTPGDCSGTTVMNTTTKALTITGTGNAGGSVGDRWGLHLTLDAGI